MNTESEDDFDWDDEDSDDDKEVVKETTPTRSLVGWDSKIATHDSTARCRLPLSKKTRLRPLHLLLHQHETAVLIVLMSCPPLTLAAWVRQPSN